MPGGSRQLDSRRFAWWLAVTTAVALLVRVAYVLIERRDFDPGGDAFFYHAGANLLADGRGFISPFFVEQGREVAAAEHPPLYLLYLAVPSVLGMTSVLTHLLWSCVLGAATVTVTGLVGREVGGERVGLVAAALAAVYPNMWAPDGMLQAETAAMFASVLAVWLAYRYWRAPSWGRLAAVAAAAAGGALARSELLLLVPLLVVPLALLRKQHPWRARARWAVVATGVAVFVVSPWLAYNATRFEHPVLMSTQFEPLLASANCDSTYYGDLRGYYDINCAAAIARREGLGPDDDQSEEARVYRRAALEYVGDHLHRVPEVVGVRLLRIAGLYQPGLYARGDALIEGRDLWVSWAALYSFYAIAVLAAAGGVLVRRARTVPVFPLLAPIAMVVITVVVTYASTRFRATAEPVLAVLAGVTIDAGVRALALRRPRGSDRRCGSRAP